MYAKTSNFCFKTYACYFNISLCFSDFAANDYINKRVLGSESKISIDNATY